MNYVELPPHLYQNVMRSVNLAAQKRARLRLIINNVSLVITGLLFLSTVGWFARDVVQGGFLDSLKLVYSDGRVVITYWKDFIQMLLETLPFTSLLASLLGVCVFMESVRRSIIGRSRYGRALTA